MLAKIFDHQGALFSFKSAANIKLNGEVFDLKFTQLISSFGRKNLRIYVRKFDLINFKKEIVRKINALEPLSFLLERKPQFSSF